MPAPLLMVLLQHFPPYPPFACCLPPAWWVDVPPAPACHPALASYPCLPRTCLPACVFLHLPRCLCLACPPRDGEPADTLLLAGPVVGTLVNPQLPTHPRAAGDGGGWDGPYPAPCRRRYAPARRFTCLPRTDLVLPRLPRLASDGRTAPCGTGVSCRLPRSRCCLRYG